LGAAILAAMQKLFNLLYRKFGHANDGREFFRSHRNAFDEISELPTAFLVRIARSRQVYRVHEGVFGHVRRPFVKSHDRSFLADSNGTVDIDVKCSAPALIANGHCPIWL
jgi:hypothetical protein